MLDICLFNRNYWYNVIEKLLLKDYENLGMMDKHLFNVYPFIFFADFELLNK
ncbi:MAG: hypothetical protein ACJAX4_000967 [Clostridium sp.]|jgi:hypothetical protein